MFFREIPGVLGRLVSFNTTSRFLLGLPVSPDYLSVSCGCSVQSCLFVQCWPEIFFVQCRENLCNVGAAFVATDYHQKINRFKKKIAEKLILRRHCTGFFPVQYCLKSLGQHCTGFLPVQCSPKSITTPLNRIFSCTMLSGASRTTFHKVFTCAMLPQEY